MSNLSNLSNGPNRHALDVAFTFFNEINIISQLTSNMFRQVLPHGLTESQFTVLNWFVRVDSEATPGRLATALMLTRGAMTNILGRLEDKGFVQIEPDATSGRQKRVTMTPAGRAARDDAIAASAPLLLEFNEAFDVAATEALIPRLQEVRRYLDELRYAPGAGEGSSRD